MRGDDVLIRGCFVVVMYRCPLVFRQRKHGVYCLDSECAVLISLKALHSKIYRRSLLQTALFDSVLLWQRNSKQKLSDVLHISFGFELYYIMVLAFMSCPRSCEHVWFNHRR